MQDVWMENKKGPYEIYKYINLGMKYKNRIMGYDASSLPPITQYL